MELQNSRILITGGSLGIGKETAKCLVDAGALVGITGRNAERLQIAADYSGAFPIVADITKPEDIERTYQEFLAHATAYDITGVDNFAGLNEYGEYKIPMSWATVMMFRKSTHTRLIFDCMRMIRANWRHYKDLYRIVSSTYRNDHALSIALNIVNGQTLEYTSIPWNLASVTPEHTVTRTSKDCYRIDYVDRDKRPRWTTVRNQDFHAMGKHHLEKIIETC